MWALVGRTLGSETNGTSPYASTHIYIYNTLSDIHIPHRWPAPRAFPSMQAGRAGRHALRVQRHPPRAQGPDQGAGVAVVVAIVAVFPVSVGLVATGWLVGWLAVGWLVGWLVWLVR